MGKAVLDGLRTAFTKASEPDRNWFDTRVVHVASGAATAYVYAPRPFPLGAQVTGRLRAVSRDAKPGTHTLSVTRVGQGFALSRVTWNTRPTAIEPGVQVTKTAPEAGEEWLFDVSAHLQAISDGEAWRGWRITSDNATILALVNAEWRLEAEWSDAPHAPTDLLPSGGLAVSVAAPTVRYAHEDVSGDTTLAAHRVQVNGTDSWAAPEFDSGEVATSTPEMDLAAQGWVGLADGGSAFWRGKVKDGAGEWSDWSDAARFTRAIKGTLDLTSPAGGTVTDPSPLVTWTLTGATQEAYRVRVLGSAGRVLWTTGIITGTETAVTIPEGVIRREGVDYVVEVAVWDTVDRVSTPGDAARYEVSRTVRLDTSSGVAPVDTLSVAPDADQVGAVLSFGRVNTPDAFVVMRDSLVVARLDPVEDLGDPEPEQVVATNLLTNPSAELDVGWTSNDPAQWVASWDTAVPRSGARSRRSELAAGVTSPWILHMGNVGHSTTSRPAVTPGEVRTGSVYLRAGQAGYRGRTDIQWLDSAGSFLSSVTGAYTVLSSGVWTRVSVAGTAPPNAAQVRMMAYVGTESGASATPGHFAHADDAMLVTGDTLPGHFDGDTPSADGYAYRWTGTPHASTSEKLTPQTWTWTDETAHPRRDLRWRVRAIENGAMSAGNPGYTAWLEPEGIWVVDPVDGTRVCLEGDDPGQWDMGEQSATHVPLGADRPVKVTQGMQGYSTDFGPLFLSDQYGGPTAQEWRDRLMVIKGHPSRVLRLVLHDQNIPVTLSNIVPSPAPVGDQVRFAVRMRADQAGELDFDWKR